MATYGTFVDGVTFKASEANDFLVWTSFTPQIFQGGAALGLLGGARSSYARVNDLIIYQLTVTMSTSSASAGSAIEALLPINASADTPRVIGSGFILGSSNLDRFAVVRQSATRVRFLSDTTTSLTTFIGQTNGPAITLTGNQIQFSIMYEAA